jgi:hypothetical protein
MKSAISTTVVGVDGHTYRELSIEDINTLACDVQFYLRTEIARGEWHFRKSIFTPETNRNVGTSYIPKFALTYYMRVDNDKPEYECE